ncbi:unnamed protein product, partial [Phaeothamnion confervicola]
RLPIENRRDLQINILRKLSAILNISLQPEAQEINERLVQVARAHGDAQVEAEALLDLAFLLAQSDRSRSRQAVAEAWTASQRISLSEARAAVEIGCIYWTFAELGWDAQRAAQVHRNHELIQSSPDRESYATYLMYYGYILWCGSEYDRAASLTKWGQQLMFRRSNPYLHLEYRLSQSSLSVAYTLGGKWGTAMTELEVSRQRASRNGDLFRVVLLDLFRAYLLFHVGDYETVFQQATLALEELGAENLSLAAWHTLHGLAARRLGRLENAKTSLQSARELLMRSTGSVFFDWHWRILATVGWSEFWLDQRKFTAAREEFHRVVELSQATEEHTWRALVFELGARIELAAEDSRQARLYLEKAL